MKITDSSARKSNNLNLAYFKIRITLKLFVALIYLIQTIGRSVALPFDDTKTDTSEIFLIISLPFSLMMTLFLVFEYLLFRIKGPEIVRYSATIDLIVYLCYMTDWILIEVSDLNRIQETVPTSFRLIALYGFSAFSWRILLVTFIVQKWQLKIIAPSLAILVATGYCVHYNQSHPGLLLARALTQLLYVIIIVYYEDKMKWDLMWTNLKQENWIQVSTFILNNIPENIMLLNIAGETKLMSESCKSFMKKCDIALDAPKELFRKIRDLNQQDEAQSFSESAAANMERMATCHGLLAPEENPQENDFLRIEALEDITSNFTKVIKFKNLREKEFLIYNGKLKMENNLPEKSIEVKISFVQHFDKDYIILIFRDTTQRDLLVALKETNQYKDRLLASISHELRAPLNGNINLVESAVNSCQIPEKIKENLLVPALRSSQVLLHIINDILDMTQIKEKKLRLVFESADLKETLKNAAQLVEIQARKKRLEFEVELDPNISKDFNTDHIRVSQIVLNLLTNAIKFTRKGIVKLSAQWMEETGRCKITVEDSGIGMSQQNVERLFSSHTNSEFEERQLESPPSVGLGLNIAQNLTAMLAPQEDQGIRVVSTPNQGSTFSFILENRENEINGGRNQFPEDSCEQIADELVESKNTIAFEKGQTLSSLSFMPLVVKQRSVENTCQCPKVLIVDDNPFNTMALETILNSLEVKCKSVYTGSDAIRKLLKPKKCECTECRGYLVVFMDQEMPQMSGAETVAEIKRLQQENQILPGVRIIGCTAHKAKEEVDKFLSSGLDHCIFKPVSIAMIKDVLKEFL